MSDELLTVGELAKGAGVTVRTLHHYDELGLLPPARRSEAGYRLYGESQVRRLKRILALRDLGFRLDQIRRYLEEPRGSVERLVEFPIAQATRRIDEARRLRTRLEEIRARLRYGHDASTDALLDAARAIAAFDRHFSARQRAELAGRSRRLGEEGLGEAHDRWRSVLERFEREMQAGTDP